MSAICVIDDTEVVRESVAATLRRCDHQVSTFADAREGVESINSAHYDLVITDLKMPRMDGLSVIRRLRDAKCEAPIIVMTGYGTVATAVEAMKLGAFDFIQKPFEADSLEIHVERAIQHHRLCVENEALKTSINDYRQSRAMIGDSEAMNLIRVKISQYGASEATVLICGESGTGKELAAAAVHAESSRRDRPLLCLNCAALSGNLLESELFGHERGAFTGADRLRKGRFELAHGGTLLLDEISEMALPLQAKLLRVLQEGEFERVGSSVTVRSDVRIIATTNRDLQAWCSKKRFREDLFYRLNVLPLHLPSLRDRKEDVADIVAHFLGRFARQAGRAPLRVDAAAMRLLTDYRWPGNIRELENLCQRAVATATRDVVSAGDLEQWLRGESDGAGQSFANLRPGRMLEDMERKLIEQTLRQYGGHRVKSAKALGMGVRTLGLKLKQWREQAAAEQCGGALQPV